MWRTLLWLNFLLICTSLLIHYFSQSFSLVVLSQLRYRVFLNYSFFLFSSLCSPRFLFFRSVFATISSYGYDLMRVLQSSTSCSNELMEIYNKERNNQKTHPAFLHTDFPIVCNQHSNRADKAHNEVEIKVINILIHSTFSVTQVRSGSRIYQSPHCSKDFSVYTKWRAFLFIWCNFLWCNCHLEL